MPEFRHQIMSPEVVGQRHRMVDAHLNMKMGLLRSWLVEATDDGIDTMYPVRTCSGTTGSWGPAPSGFSRYELGAYSITDLQFDQLVDTAANPHVPEIVTVTNEDLSVTQSLVAFDVWGMAQHLRAFFHRGQSSHPSHLPVPDNYWFLKSVSLAS